MEQQIKNNKIILKNVLSDEHFKSIMDTILSDRFPWFYQNHVVYEEQATAEEKYQIQFVHKFHENSNITTSPEIWNMCFPIFAVLQPHTFLRVKANNIPGNDSQVSHGFHTDTTVPLSWTAIYYVNTNNGYTEFEDGTKIDSVANSMIIFPSNKKHSGSTCTDKRSRINININFITDNTNKLVKDIWPEEFKKIVETWI